MQKTEGLNRYIVSVYLSNPITVLPSTLEAEFTVLNNVNISVPTIENNLASCSDSALMGNDFSHPPLRVIVPLNQLLSLLFYSPDFGKTSNRELFGKHP